MIVVASEYWRHQRKTAVFYRLEFARHEVLQWWLTDTEESAQERCGAPPARTLAAERGPQFS